MCSSRKYPYPPHGRSLEFPGRVGGGGGRGVQNKKPSVGGVWLFSGTAPTVPSFYGKLFLLQLLSSLEDYDVLVNQVPTWERRLSSLLGNTRIVFDQESPSVSVTEYLNYLYRMVSSLRRGLLEPDASVSIQPGEFKDFTTRMLRYVISQQDIINL